MAPIAGQRSSVTQCSSRRQVDSSFRELKVTVIESVIELEGMEVKNEVGASLPEPRPMDGDMAPWRRRHWVIILL